jgi:hypothetical protein
MDFEGVCRNAGKVLPENMKVASAKLVVTNKECLEMVTVIEYFGEGSAFITEFIVGKTESI